VFRCADDLLGRQIRNSKDVYRYGRWHESLSSSGAGWMAEVFSELYQYCVSQDMDGCKRFEDSIVKVLRLLMQYTYSPQNAFVAKNPEMAIGGVFWNVGERYVRTDAVCHAMNAYMAMVDRLAPGPLLEIPEPPLLTRLVLTDVQAAPDSVQPDSVQPDSVQPDSVQPDSVQPDSVQPDSDEL
jgi:hypothetical protein